MNENNIVNIKIDLFAENVVVIVTDSEKDVAKITKDHEVLEMVNDHQGLSFNATYNNKYSRIVWIRHFDIAILTHELYHTTQYICRHHGIKDEETAAYIIEYLTRKTLHKLVG